MTDTCEFCGEFIDFMGCGCIREYEAIMDKKAGTSECKHEWETRYTKRFYADGVEWYCIHCRENLPWPEARRRVNAAECLSAEEAKEAASYAQTQVVIDALRSYAKTREQS